MTGTRACAEAKKVLQAAMERLLAGKPTRTGGRLIKENLYKEAGVSRATMNPAPTSSLHGTDGQPWPVPAPPVKPDETPN
jgi:hypothetical protein